MKEAKGCTVWIYDHSGDEAIAECSARLAAAFRDKNLPVEEIDAATFARKAYEEKAGWFTLTMAVGFTSHCLNRHGIHVIIRSAKGPSSGFRWGKYKPERLLDVVLDGEPMLTDKPTPTVRLDSTRSLDDQGLEQVQVDVGKVVEGLGKMGWIGEVDEQVPPPVEDEEIRRRLEQLGYL